RPRAPCSRAPDLAFAGLPLSPPPRSSVLVRAETDGENRGRVSLKGGALLAGLGVPQLDLAEEGFPLRIEARPAGAGQRLAVRAEGHGREGAGVPLEGGALLAGPGVPQLDVARPQQPAPTAKGLAVRPEADGR